MILVPTAVTHRLSIKSHVEQEKEVEEVEEEGTVCRERERREDEGGREGLVK